MNRGEDRAANNPCCTLCAGLYVCTSMSRVEYESSRKENAEHPTVQNYKSLLQNIVSCIGLFRKRDLWFSQRGKCRASNNEFLSHTLCWHVQPIAFGVSWNLNLQSQSPMSLFNGKWLKRHREINHRLRFENEEMTLQLQQEVYIYCWVLYLRFLILQQGGVKS